MQENKIVKLDDIEHALLRAPMYIGSPKQHETLRHIIKDQKIVHEDCKYTPALLKLMREIIDNSIDEYLRTKGSFSNKINIYLDNEKLIVEDNGRGIPIKPAYDSQGNEIPDSVMPLMAWTNLKAGSNFDDNNTDNTSIGQNGVGASLATIFSKEFIGETCDGENYFKLVAKDNMKEVNHKITKKNHHKRGTTVTFIPDLSRFDENEIRDIYKDLIYFDLIFLSITYPDITFKFNDEIIKINSLNHLNKTFFNNELVIVSGEYLDYAVGSTESQEFIHFINGVNAYEGGKVLEYLNKRLLVPVYDKLVKKYKNLRFQDFNSKIFSISIIRGLPNPRFTNQMKTSCDNTASQFPKIAEEIIGVGNSRFIDRVYKNKSIIEPIIDLYKAKQLIQDQKALKKTKKTKRELPKYWKPAKEYNYLILTEGDSAVDSIISGVGRDDKGYFPLKGKILNVLKTPISKIAKNEEISNIIDILNLDPGNENNHLPLSDKYYNIDGNIVNENDEILISSPDGSKWIKVQDINNKKEVIGSTIQGYNPDKTFIRRSLQNDGIKYQNLVFATDADVDGIHIRALLLSFIYKFAPDMIINKRVYNLITPIVIIFKNDVIQEFVFSLDDLEEMEKKYKGCRFKYTKGLGGLSEEDWDELFKRYKFEDLLEVITIQDNNDIKKLLLWMEEDRDYRKKIIKENIKNFNINKV